jgi:hypothetical protein
MCKSASFQMRASVGAIAWLAASCANSPAEAQQAGQTPPKSGQIQPIPDPRPGETLTRELDRNKGVISPPSTDPGMTIPVPPAGGDSMPVIPPPSGPDMQPK